MIPVWVAPGGTKYKTTISLSIRLSCGFSEDGRTQGIALLCQGRAYEVALADIDAAPSDEVIGGDGAKPKIGGLTPIA